MDSVGSDKFAKSGQDLADTTADKLQRGIRTAKQSVDNAADGLSQKVESARSNAGATLGSAAAEAQSITQQSIDSLKAATEKLRVTAAEMGESVISYTQDNPVKVILISAAVGALVGALVTVLATSRD
jgi:ElaB/YqjD/DUF883 family membrane-anchored ribosome-binding protein